MHICIYTIYICRYHWVLLILAVEAGNLVVFDSMRNPKSAIQHIIDPCLTGKFSLYNQILFQLITIVEYQT